MFAEPDGTVCRSFLGRVFLASEINSAVIRPKPDHEVTSAVELRFDSTQHSQRQVLEQVAAMLDAASSIDQCPEVPSALTARDHRGAVRYHRYGPRVTGWRVVSERVGMIKLENPVLYRKAALCEAVERELTSVLGVERYETSASSCYARVEYDPRQLSPVQIVEILDGALTTAEQSDRLDPLDLDLAICTASLPLAAIAQFAFPPLFPVSAALFAYTSIPSFRGAYNVLFKERRFGVDLLDSVVIRGCLATLQVFPGAILAWCLSIGRYLVRRTEDHSKKLLLEAFGKQPRYVWLVKDGVEIEMSLDRLEKGDLVAVHTGEMVPVDGVIVEGLAMIDQHALTGESTPAEKGVGDRVFASTVMVAGKVHVAVEKSGGETAAARIAQILGDSAGYKLASQHKGEQIADKVVLPTLGLGGLAFVTLGTTSAVAVVNSDLGTGIRKALQDIWTRSLLGSDRIYVISPNRSLSLIQKGADVTRTSGKFDRKLPFHPFIARRSKLRSGEPQRMSV